MEFAQLCTEASVNLLALSSRLEHLEIQLLALDERRGDDELVTAIVAGLQVAKDLSDQLLQSQIPRVAEEESAVALAIRIALQELTRRYLGVKHDLEVMVATKQKRKSGQYARVVPIRRSRTG